MMKTKTLPADSRLRKQNRLLRAEIDRLKTVNKSLIAKLEKHFREFLNSP